MAEIGVVTRVRRSLADLFAPKSERTGSLLGERPTGPRPEVHPASDRADRDFLQQLRGIVTQNGGKVQAGRINVIGLDGLKERLGKRWLDLADRVHALARSAIERYLQPGDIYLARGDNFIIAFASPDLAQAQIKCRMIAQLIEETLLGDGSNDILSVATAVATLDGDIVLEDMPSLADMIAAEAHRPLAGNVEMLEAVPALEAPPQPSRAAARAVGRSNQLDYEIFWRPVWDPIRNVVPIYQAELSESHVPGLLAPLSFDENEIECRDIALRESATAAVNALARDGQVLLLVLTVEFETLAKLARRYRYIKALAESVTAEARKFLIISLTGVPQGVPGSRLGEITSALRPYCNRVSVQLPLETSDFSNLRHTHIFAVGTDITNCPQSETVLFMQLEQFARGAERAGAMIRFIRGVRSVTVATAALGGGFTYLSGNAIAPSAKQIAGARSLTLEDLYRARVP